MKTLAIDKAGDLLARYEKDPNQEAVILTYGGKPLAVILPTGGADIETISLSLNSKFLAIMERSRRSYYEQGGFSLEEVRRQFGLKPDEPTKANTKPRKGSNSRRQARTKVPKGDEK